MLRYGDRKITDVKKERDVPIRVLRLTPFVVRHF